MNLQTDSYQLSQWYMYGARQYNWVFPDQDNRTPEQYPYAYSMYYTLGNATTAKDCDGAYSDRLRQWSAEKYEAAMQVVDRLGIRKGDYWWRHVNLNQLSQIMSAYCGRQVAATALAEGCNVGNGYPVWYVWFKDI